MKFVLFHGAFGSPGSNWLPELKDKLELLGQEVIAPQFPVDAWDEVAKSGDHWSPKNQSLTHWQDVFEEEVLPKLPGDSVCFVGHSLGPLFILHMVDHYNIKCDSAIFVSPFLTKLDRMKEIDFVNDTFYKSDFNFEKLKQNIPLSYAIYARDDPYVPTPKAKDFATRMDSQIIESNTGKHFNSEAHCVSFPLVLELCKTRLPTGKEENYFSSV